MFSCEGLKNCLMETKTYQGTLEQLICELLPTALISDVYTICEKNNYPEDKVINVQTFNNKLLVW